MRWTSALVVLGACGDPDARCEALAGRALFPTTDLSSAARVDDEVWVIESEPIWTLSRLDCSLSPTGLAQSVDVPSDTIAVAVQAGRKWVVVHSASFQQAQARVFDRRGNLVRTYRDIAAVRAADGASAVLTREDDGLRLIDLGTDEPITSLSLDGNATMGWDGDTWRIASCREGLCSVTRVTLRGEITEADPKMGLRYADGPGFLQATLEDETVTLERADGTTASLPGPFNVLFDDGERTLMTLGPQMKTIGRDLQVERTDYTSEPLLLGTLGSQAILFGGAHGVGSWTP